MKPIIGRTAHGSSEVDVHIDPVALTEGHLLIQASSGGGKSWLIRKLLEETFGYFPHIVLDVEGELKTLREKFDYIVAGADDADCLAHPRTAKLLARRLLELNASCIIDLYELKPFEKPMFVKDFVEALLHAPKELWAPRLVVIDEAHLFAPEGEKKGQVSAAAVCDLMGRGRKRGLGVVLATQRLSKLRKDAAGECRNKMVGFCNLLADRRRAADDLGFGGKDGLELVRKLDTGQFWAVGPAISKRDVIQIKVGKVSTTHPRPGQGLQAALPPPKDKVRKLLNELKDLPKQAQEEARTLADAQTRIKELERQLRATPAQPAPQQGPSKAELQQREKAQRDLAKQLDVLQKSIEGDRVHYQQLLSAVEVAFDVQLSNLQRAVKKTLNDAKIKRPTTRMLNMTLGTKTGRISSSVENISNRPKSLITPAEHIKVDLVMADPPSGDLSGGARRLVEVLVRCMPAAFTKAQWASLADLSHTSGTFGTYLSKIRSMGLVREDNGLFRPTEAAVELIGLAPGQTMSPKTNEEVVEMWKRALGGTPAKMVEVLRESFPDPMTRSDLAIKVGITHTSGTFGTYFSKLRSNGLVEVNGDWVRAADPLLWEPGGVVSHA